MAYDDTAWNVAVGKRQSETFLLSRFLEHTDADLEKQLKPVTTDKLAFVEKFPCLFMSELHTEEDGNREYVTLRVGRISDLAVKNNEIVYSFVLDKDFGTFFVDDRKGIESALGLRDWELNRTHWAVKKGDLIESLRKLGLELDARNQPGEPAAPLPNVPPAQSSAESLERKDGTRFNANAASKMLQQVGKLYEEPQNAQAGAALVKPEKVFIVHGHDEYAKEAVARYLEYIGLEAIILHEQTNQGRTIIEKFERFSDVGFAVVLLTPDDSGGKKAASPRDRARQNVIFEWGYFIGKLGRDRVVALKKGDIEMPTDLSGVLWHEMDGGGGWKLALARELGEAGFTINWERAAKR